MEIINLTSDCNDVRIDAWLAGKLDNYSRTYIQKLVECENVLVNGKIIKTNYKVKQNDEILVKIPDPILLDVKAEKMELEVLFEDSDIIVVNKPKGMVVHPAAGNHSGTLVNALMGYCGDTLSDINGVIRPGIVHRIDKDTSGVLVVAKNNFAHEKLSEKLKNHDIKRVYFALVDGIIRENLGKIDAPIGRHPVDRKRMAVNSKNGRRAVTHFKVLERFSDATLIEVSLETGRTHQIRVHMAYIGFPIMGDEVYGKRKQKFDTAGQVLHAKILGFNHPVSGEYIEFETDLPEYFEKLLDELRKENNS
jgi:23S rRNA pseudouridine1911/1915/1917 synthase